MCGAARSEWFEARRPLRHAVQIRGPGRRVEAQSTHLARPIQLSTPHSAVSSNCHRRLVTSNSIRR